MADRLASAHWRAQGEGSRRVGVPSPHPLALGRPERGAPGRVGRAQLPDPGRPRFEAGNGRPGPGRPDLRLCDCGRLFGAVAGEPGASPTAGGVVVVVFCGGSGVTTLPGEVGEGRRRSWPARGGVTEAKCTCVSVLERGRVGGRARAEAPWPARRREQRAGPSSGRKPAGSGGSGPAGGPAAEARRGKEPRRRRRRRRRARAFQGRRIRACARRRSVRVEPSDACAFTCARESGKSVGRLEGEWGVERRSRRRAGEAAPAQCAAEELCVCESLTGSKWRRLLQRLLLCEGNNTPPRQQRRRLRLAEHLSRGWACRRSVSSGRGAHREEEQRQGGPSPGIPSLRLGSNRGLVPQRGARAEGETRGEPGPPARRAWPLPPSLPPGAGARVPGGRGGAGSLGPAGLS